MVMAADTDALSPAGAARRLGITPAAVRQMCRQGRLAFRMTPLGRLIDSGDVERLAAERTQKETIA